MMKLSNRQEALRAWVAQICSEEGVRALVRDGWTEAMAREGLRLHQKTWNIRVISRAAMAEAAQGAEFDLSEAGFSQVGEEVWNALVAELPRAVGHIWPSLPGAGVTPVLYMSLAGIEQVIQLSRRGRNFAKFVLGCAPSGVRETSDVFEESLGAIVVSGGNDTLSAVRERATCRVVGYGHRVSFAVTSGRDPHALARDVVMWSQGGCFSVRAVVFVGPNAAARAFAEDLAQAIGALERLWGVSEDETQAAQRMQARAVADFTADVFFAERGWVALSDTPWTDATLPSNTVSLHRVDAIEDLKNMVLVGSDGLQGVALDLERSDPRWGAWEARCAALGATRIAQAGEMQAPPGDWRHDGRPNLRCLLA